VPDIDRSFVFDGVLLQLDQSGAILLVRVGWAVLLVTCGQGGRRVNGIIQSQVGVDAEDR